MSDELNETRGSETREEEKLPSDDGQPIIRERTQGERLAYQQGYQAALRNVRRDIDRAEKAAEIMLEIKERTDPIPDRTTQA